MATSTRGSDFHSLLGVVGSFISNDLVQRTYMPKSLEETGRARHHTLKLERSWLLNSLPQRELPRLWLDLSCRIWPKGSSPCPNYSEHGFQMWAENWLFLKELEFRPIPSHLCFLRSQPWQFYPLPFGFSKTLLVNARVARLCFINLSEAHWVFLPAESMWMYVDQAHKCWWCISRKIQRELCMVKRPCLTDRERRKGWDWNIAMTGLPRRSRIWQGRIGTWGLPGTWCTFEPLRRRHAPNGHLWVRMYMAPEARAGSSLTDD